VAASWRVATFGGSASAGPFTARVAITKGNDRADNAFRAMQFFKKPLAAAIANKRVIIKPNLVSDTSELADTHVDWVEGVLEFLKSIGKTNVWIAESNPRSTLAAFDNMGYLRLLNKYPARLVDLNQEGADEVQVWRNETTLHSIRVSRLLRNPNYFIISCPRIKTHNSVVATLAVKNVVMAAPMVDAGFRYGQQGASKFSKTGMHGVPSNNQCINDNIYRLVKLYGIRAHFSVIDGYEGMQGDGPTSGYAAPQQKLGIASFDWVAADRVCVTLMGHDVYQLGNTGPYPAYLNYCGQAGLGEWDLNKIEILGESIAGNIVNYAPPESISAMLGMRPTPKE